VDCGQHRDLAAPKVQDLADLDFLVTQPRLLGRGNHGEIRPHVPIEQILLQDLDRRAQRIHRDGMRPQRADRIDEKRDRVDVVEVRMSDKDT